MESRRISVEELIQLQDNRRHLINRYYEVGYSQLLVIICFCCAVNQIVLVDWSLTRATSWSQTYTKKHDP